VDVAATGATGCVGKGDAAIGVDVLFPQAMVTKARISKPNPILEVHFMINLQRQKNRIRYESQDML
jgi:hypothetical protein